LTIEDYWGDINDGLASKFPKQRVFDKQMYVEALAINIGVEMGHYGIEVDASKLIELIAEGKTIGKEIGKEDWEK
jgi:hypothetical protein